MCELDSRARSQNWEHKNWTPRTSLEPGSKNILRKSLVDPRKVLLPPLHIKLGTMKQFVKAWQNLEIVSSTFAKSFLICQRPN
jgi:hypothetical protein